MPDHHLLRRGLLLALFLVGGAPGAGCSRARPPPGDGAAAGPRWREGAAYTYAVSLTSRASLASSTRSTALVLHAKLELRPRSQGSTTSFLATLRGLDVRAGEGTDETLPAGLTGELSAPFGVTLTDGRAESLRVRGGTRPLAIGVLGTLAAALQQPTTLPGPGGSTVSERDSTGRYLARYTPTAPGLLAREKLSYEPLAPQRAQTASLPGFDLRPRVVASRAELESNGGELSSCSAHEELELGLTPTSRVSSTTELGLRLEARRDDAGPADWQGLWASTVELPLGSQLPTDEPARALDARRIAGVRFADALAAVEKQSRAAPGEAHVPLDVSAPDVAVAREQLGSFATLVALLRAHDADVQSAVAAIGRGSPARRVLLDALSSASTPAAQAALITLLEERATPLDLRRDAAYALMRSPRPGAATVEALVGALDDPRVASFAQLGLGTCSRRLREQGEPELAARASSILLARLASAAGDRERAELLRAIANSGDARAFPAVRPFLDAPDESVREAAVSAVRLMPNPEVDTLVAAHLGPEEKQGVRLAALDAASRRPPGDELVEAVGRAATGAPDSQSRVRAVKLLERWAPSRPEVHAVLLRVADGDHLEAVRQAALAALAR